MNKPVWVTASPLQPMPMAPADEVGPDVALLSEGFDDRNFADAPSLRQLSLSSRTVDAFAWRFVSESAKLVLQIAVQIILARLLPVEAFGLLAVASLVVNFGSRVSEIGTGPALIQRSTINSTHVRVAFSLSVVSGMLVTAGIWFGAPLTAAVFKADAATPVLRLIGLVFVVGSIGTTAEALMLRRMDYRRLLRVELVSYAFGYATVGISLAFLHYGVWALAWATVAQTLLKTIMLMVMSPHPVRPCLARAESKQLLNFGIGMTLGRLASFAAQNADYFVVGRWLGTTALGLYSRAYQLMCLPIYQFSSILNSVLFRAYSSIQTDSLRLRRGYLASVCLSSIIVFPALTTIAIVAPELMIGIFGAQWAATAPPLRILCVAGAFYCVYNLADSLVRAAGAVYEKFLYHSIYACCVLGGAFVGSRWGVSGVAAGVAWATAVGYLLMARLSLRLTGAEWRPFFAAQWPGVAVSFAVAVVGVPVAALMRVAELGPLEVLTGTFLSCGAAAVAVLFAAPSGWLTDSVREIIESAKKYAFEAVVNVRRRYRAETV
jgi:O-antigen/teichoic acid export membrane protein